MATSKVEIMRDGQPETLIDLTGDTITEETAAEGTTFHDATGEQKAGKMPITNVLYTEQNLTDAQKQQARTNIGAANANDLGGTVEITNGNPTKTQTVMTIDPSGEEVSIYTADEVDQKLGAISEQKADQSEVYSKTEIDNKGYAIERGLTLGKASDGLVYLFVNGSPQGNGLEIKADVEGDVIGYIGDNNVIVLTGNLAEGVYTLKYEDENGKVTEIGTLDHSTTPEIICTNLFDPSKATLNTRMSGSSNAPKAQDGYVMTAVIMLPITFNVTGSSKEHFITVPTSMWSGSANIFTGNSASNVQGFNDVAGAGATVVGNWTKIPISNKWGTNHSCDRIVVSLYVKGSAITASDIQNIGIYFDEIPE